MPGINERPEQIPDHTYHPMDMRRMQDVTPFKELSADIAKQYTSTFWSDFKSVIGIDNKNLWGAIKTPQKQKRTYGKSRKSLILRWYERRDSNPHGVKPLEPKSSASANSATLAA